MLSIDLLFHWAEKMGVRVEYKKLHPNLLGKADAVRKRIALDMSLKDRPRLMKCVFAHEIGHILFPPRPGHIRYHSRGFWMSEDSGLIKAIVGQDERKAMDWATQVLMPDAIFDRLAENGGYSLNELADYFDVEPEFVEHKIGYYRRKQRDAGKKVKWRDIIRRDHTSTHWGL